MYRVFVIVFIMIAGVTPSLAASISGTVSDDGVPLEAVELTLMDADSNVIVSKARTDKLGHYHFIVEPGRYKLRAAIKEYADEWKRDIHIDKSDRVVDIGMAPAVFRDSNAVPPADDCD